MTELGPEVLDWIERVTGGRDVETQLVTSGGRLGYRVDVTVDGARRPLFLQRGRNPGTGSFMGFAREAEVYRALEPLGVKVAHVWGVDEALNVLAWEGVVALGLLIVLAPFALVALAAWLGRRLYRRHEDERLLAM